MHHKQKHKHDYTNLYTSCVAKFSGNWNNSTNAGTFQLNVNNTASNSATNITAHLLFSFIILRFHRLWSLKYTLVTLLPCHLAKHKKFKNCIGNTLV